LSTNFAPKRGEIWLVNFDPTIGAEIRKIRPAVIVSSDDIGKLLVKLIAPITDWKDRFNYNLWHIQLEPNNENGLRKPSAIDTLQLRGVDIQRCIRRLGNVSESTMREITIAVAAVIEYSS
jgi:mRNA interferase MazF